MFRNSQKNLGYHQQNWIATATSLKNTISSKRGICLFLFLTYPAPEKPFPYSMFKTIIGPAGRPVYSTNKWISLFNICILSSYPYISRLFSGFQENVSRDRIDNIKANERRQVELKKTSVVGCERGKPLGKTWSSCVIG